MDLFLFDCETHIGLPTDDIAYYPNFKAFRGSVAGLSRGLETSTGQEMAESGGKVKASVEALLSSMDEAGVQMACVLPEVMLQLSYGHRARSTNGWVAQEISRYPDRLVGVANVGPIVERGVNNAIWELEYLVKEMNFKGCKLYGPDEVPMNDQRLWPFYKKIQELGIVLFIHTGFAWLGGGGRTANCIPILLEDVCENFPEIPIVAYHLGYPYHNELNIEAAKFPNLYIGTSLLRGLGGKGSKRAQELLGEAVRWAGSDKICWGTDWGGPVSRHKDEVDFIMNIQFSEELQRDYGYSPISEEDRRKWTGLNLARIMNIEPTSREGGEGSVMMLS